MISKYQKSIKENVKIDGISLISGKNTGIELSPLSPNSGINFYTQFGDRVILSDKINVDTPFSTNIKDVSVIEHLLSALHALGIDNIKIKVYGDGIPFFDGSALQIYNLIGEDNIVKYDEIKQYNIIQKKICIKDDDKFLCIEPYDTFLIDFTIKFDHPLIQTQHFIFDMYDDSYIDLIAPARTFGFVKDYNKMKDVVKGISFDNLILLDNYNIVNTTLKFNNEFVRHKILDIIGDTYIHGKPIIGKITTCCSGHKMNNKLMKLI